METIYAIKEWIAEYQLQIILVLWICMLLFVPYPLLRSFSKNGIKFRKKQIVIFFLLFALFTGFLFFPVLPIFAFGFEFFIMILREIFANIIGEDTAYFAFLICLVAFVVVFHLVQRNFLISFATRNYYSHDSVQQNIPLPSPEPEQISTPCETKPIPFNAAETQQRFKKNLGWKIGWQMTVLMGISMAVMNIVMMQSFDERSREFHFRGIYSLSNALSRYMEQHHSYPTSFGDLVNEGYASPNNFATDKTDIQALRYSESGKFKAPAYAHFIFLPVNAPKDLLWVWIDPEQYEWTTIPVAFFNGETKFIKKKELPALIERSQKWLAEHPPATFCK